LRGISFILFLRESPAKAGVREYWEVYPENQSLHAHCFQSPGSQLLTRIYGVKDTAAAEILPGLEIELGPVFAE
jgi:Uma2 family endonuclease